MPEVQGPHVGPKLSFLKSFTSPLKGQRETEANARLGPDLKWTTLLFSIENLSIRIPGPYRTITDGLNLGLVGKNKRLTKVDLFGVGR